jgi:hypothetical protein
MKEGIHMGGAGLVLTTCASWAAGSRQVHDSASIHGDALGAAEAFRVSGDYP